MTITTRREAVIKQRMEKLRTKFKRDFPYVDEAALEVGLRLIEKKTLLIGQVITMFSDVHRARREILQVEEFCKNLIGRDMPEEKMPK